MRLQETLCLIELAGVMALTAPLRTESRAEGQASYNVRSDFPALDRKLGNTMFVARMGGERVEVERRKCLEHRLGYIGRTVRTLLLGPRFK
jgi:succinate dehydrogenase/fumarate reductase flavoprotein subunit